MPESGTAVSRAGAPSQMDPSAGLCRQHEDVTASGHRHAVAVGRDVQGGEEFEWFVDPLFAGLIEVRWQGDLDLAIRPRLNVMNPQIGSQLVDNPTLRQRRPQHVKASVTSQLLRLARRLASTRVSTNTLHHPQVDRPVAIRRKVDSIVPGHRFAAGPGIIGRQRHCLGTIGPFACYFESPDRLGRSALVPLRAAALLGQTGKEHRLPIDTPIGLAGLFQGNAGDGQGFGVDQHQLRVRQSRIVASGVGNLSVASPANHARRLAIIGQPFRAPAHERHHVDISSPLVGGRKSDQPAVARDAGMSFLGQVSGQPGGLASR